MTGETSLLSGETAAPAGASSTALLAETVFQVPVHRAFDYLVPPALAGALRPGHRVLAPFGQRGHQVGLVLRVHSEPRALAPGALKPLHALLDPEPALGEKELRLARWLCDRYFCSVGQAAFGVLPVGKQPPPKRAAAEAPPAAAFAPPPAPFRLTPDQETVCARIVSAVEAPAFRPFLLWGVAAAGKTEVYVQAITRALAAGRSALYLVPEIGLTPQVQSILKQRFGPVVDVWHSEISRGDRWRIWQRVRSGQCRVLLGPRSAAFSPLKDLGLIVVDEEHDPSYKEDATPQYHAREVALERARLEGVPVVFGSATPSMESYKKALDGEFELLEMRNRVNDRPLPDVRLVDMRKNWQLLSEPLAEAVAARLEANEQTILFLNRRGFSTYIVCRDCGWEARCPACAVGLVYHKKESAAPSDTPLLDEGPKAEGLHCHYCFHHMPLPSRCPSCKQETVKLQGRGTQKTVSDLRLWFPKARLLRWDRDTTRRKGAHGRAYEAVHSEAVDVVVGTQMIAQGLDFPRVTLVGVLDADRTLKFPDFRAGERTFQLLTQVAGRAGRAERPGAVYLQTRSPDHYAVRAAAKLDYRAFAEQELAFRQEMGYPPYRRLALLLVRGKSEERVVRAAEGLLGWMQSLRLPPDVQVLGPAPSFHALKAGYTQWQVLLKGPDERIGAALAPLREYKPPKSISFQVDVDPEELS